ncbi:FxSxx-COOH system tetratricopeptide repeat protein [Nocardia abscessus]|uniref:FxSxx-COOH system tetratricopeptide repeat protein n=1 Tax=Nocardia abscessus TaxID=120957 RepID=UPI00245641B2|nr:FxSxx-COOH system tetratricopeptide repeat protein [Nocardia abscessus]
MSAGAIAFGGNLPHEPPLPVARLGRVVGAIPAQPADFIARGPLGKLQRAVERSQVVVVVTGMRGVGKTELAAAYARQLLDNDTVRLVGWINAETRGTLLEGLQAIAQRLGVADLDGDSETSAKQLREHLTGRQEPGLLVFDNATSPDDLRPFLPAASGTKVVITSTERTFSTLGAPLDLGVYSRPESVRYLRKATQITDNDGAGEVAERLGDLPLALTQAAATINHLGIDYPTYLDLLAHPGDQAFLRIEGHEYPQQVHRAISLSIATTEGPTEDPDLDAAVRNLLDLVAMLSPAGVTRDLLPDYAGRRDEAVARCVQASLLTRSTDRSAVVMHRLVARVLRERADTEQARLRLLDNALDAIEPHLFDPEEAWEHRSEGIQLVDHIDAIIAAEFPDEVRDRAARLFRARNWACEQLIEAADLARATDYARRTLLDSEKRLGAEDIQTLTARGHLGEAYRAAGRMREAIDLFQQLLTVYERILGPERLETLTARRDLASTYRAWGRTAEAIDLFQQLLTDYERILGPEDGETLNVRGNLAYAYQREGRIAEAIDLFQEVLASGERVHGIEHRRTLNTRSFLAGAFLAAGRVTEAIDRFQQLLADEERLRGPEHRRSLQARGSLAGAFLSTGQVTEAVDMFQQLLTDRERILGPDHLDTLRTRIELGSALQAAGRVPEMMALFQQVAAEGERILGRDSPFGPFNNSLAMYSQMTEQLSETATLLEQSFTEQESSQGLDHPDTLKTRSKLAHAYISAGRVTEAIDILQQLLTDRERILGPDHLDTLITRSSLAIAYVPTGRVAEAIDMFQQLLTDRERILGPDHLDTLKTRSNLASAHQVAGRVAAAIDLFQELLTDCERILGPDHLDTLKTRNKLADAHQVAGRFTEAIGMLDRLLGDRERVLGSDHQDTLRTRFSLAVAYLGIGQIAEAFEMINQFLPNMERVMMNPRGALNDWLE